MDNQQSSQDSPKYTKQKKSPVYKFAKTPNKVGCLVERLEYDSSFEQQVSTSGSSINDTSIRPLSLHVPSGTLVSINNRKS